jgi:hypothetical protein
VAQARPQLSVSNLEPHPLLLHHGDAKQGVPTSLLGIPALQPASHPLSSLWLMNSTAQLKVTCQCHGASLPRGPKRGVQWWVASWMLRHWGRGGRKGAM